MKDFIHGQLVKVASTGGVDSMLKGAGVAAAANVGIGAVQGDFDVIGNAFSGAALGGMGGAAMKYGANKYAGNLMKQADAEYSAASKKVGIFSNVEEDKALSFLGGDANTERFAKMNEAGVFSGRGYSTGDKVITGTEKKEARLDKLATAKKHYENRAKDSSLDAKDQTHAKLRATQAQDNYNKISKRTPEATIANMLARGKPKTPVTPSTAGSTPSGTAGSTSPGSGTTPPSGVSSASTASTSVPPTTSTTASGGSLP